MAVLPRKLHLRQVLQSSLPGDCVLQVLVIKIKEISVDSSFTPRPLKVHVDYGYQGSRIRCQTQRMQLAQPIQLSDALSLDVRTRFYFLWQRWHEFEVRITLKTPRPFRKTLAAAQLCVGRSPKRIQLALRDVNDKRIGSVVVTSELASMTKQQLFNISCRPDCTLWPDAMMSRASNDEKTDEAACFAARREDHQHEVVHPQATYRDEAIVERERGSSCPSSPGAQRRSLLGLSLLSTLVQALCSQELATALLPFRGACSLEED